jgi:hypothetical protein
MSRFEPGSAWPSFAVARGEVFKEHPEDTFQRHARELASWMAGASDGDRAAMALRAGRRRMYDVLGPTLWRDIMRAIWADPSWLVGRMRSAAWLLRNSSAAGVPKAQVMQAARHYLQGEDLLVDAGARPMDVCQFADCVLGRCSCEGCDLVDAERFTYLGRGNVPEDLLRTQMGEAPVGVAAARDGAFLRRYAALRKLLDGEEVEALGGTGASSAP